MLREDSEEKGWVSPRAGVPSDSGPMQMRQRSTLGAARLERKMHQGWRAT